MSLRALMQGTLPVTAGYLGGGATGYQKVALATIDIEKLLAIERATVERGPATD